MQPVLEIHKLRADSFTYTVRAPHASGEPLPEAAYVDRGLGSFVDCLRDAGQALTYFERVQVLYQDVCMGQQAVVRLENHTEAVAVELLVDYLGRDADLVSLA